MDFVILAIIGVAIGLAIGYIIKAKKSGKKCIGCPDNGSCCSCNFNSSGGCSCDCLKNKTESNK